MKPVTDQQPGPELLVSALVPQDVLRGIYGHSLVYICESEEK